MPKEPMTSDIDELEMATVSRYPDFSTDYSAKLSPKYMKNLNIHKYISIKVGLFNDGYRNRSKQLYCLITCVSYINKVLRRDYCLGYLLSRRRKKVQFQTSIYQVRRNLQGGRRFVMEIFQNIYRTWLQHFFESKNLGLQRKQKYENGSVMVQIPANSKKQILQVLIKLSSGIKNGVPAHTIVSMLILIVLNRMADISPMQMQILVQQPKRKEPMKKQLVVKMWKFGAHAHSSIEIMLSRITVRITGRRPMRQEMQLNKQPLIKPPKKKRD